jgi:hypothetical protein
MWQTEYAGIFHIGASERVVSDRKKVDDNTFRSLCYARNTMRYHCRKIGSTALYDNRQYGDYWLRKHGHEDGFDELTHEQKRRFEYIAPRRHILSDIEIFRIALIDCEPSQIIDDLGRNYVATEPVCAATDSRLHAYLTAINAQYCKKLSLSPKECSVCCTALGILWCTSRGYPILSEKIMRFVQRFEKIKKTRKGAAEMPSYGEPTEPAELPAIFMEYDEDPVLLLEDVNLSAASLSVCEEFMEGDEDPRSSLEDFFSIYEEHSYACLIQT